MSASIPLALCVAGLLLVLLGVRFWTLARRGLFPRVLARKGPLLRAGDLEEGEGHTASRRHLERLWLHPLSDVARVALAARWQGVVDLFADTPRRAVGEAQALTEEILLARGYPVDDWEWLQAGMRMVRPDIVEHFEKAREIAAKNDMTRATDRDLARAREHYQALFDGLVTHAESLPQGQPAPVAGSPLAIAPAASEQGTVPPEQPSPPPAGVRPERERPSR